MPAQFGAPDEGGSPDKSGAPDGFGVPDGLRAPGEFRVKGYEIDSLLSANASGEVWLARPQGSGEQVALKRLQLRSEQARADAERLVSVLHLIDHPHLLPVRELLPAGKAAVLVLDYADGGSLEQLLTGRGGLDPGEVVTALAPVAEALAAAHEHGLVHGDVTPEAILFTTDGRPLLSDLGVLGLVEDGNALGTHGYADPTSGGEQESGPTPQGDVYGLAAVCYTALTGLAPRPGEPRRPLSEAVPQLPPGLAHAVGVGLQPVAARRPDAAQFADLLYAACDPAPVRFPVGLVLSDADIAAVLAGSPPGEPDTHGPKDPFAQGLGARGPGDGPGGREQPRAAPPAHGVGESADAVGTYGGPGPYAGAYDTPSFAGRDAAGDTDDEDDERTGRRRIGLILAAVLGFLVLTGAVVGGIAWATRTRPADPAAAGRESQASPRDGAASVPAPSRVGRTPSRPGGAPSKATPTPPRTTQQPDRPASGPEARWRQVLADLDAQRAKAFAESDPALLGPVYERGSDLAVKDRAEIDKCVSSGCHLEGLRFDVSRLTVASDAADRVILEVVDQLQAYAVVSEAGERTEQPAGEVTTRRITLVKGPGSHWVISRIVRQ